jgi:hypothetical protein
MLLMFPPDIAAFSSSAAMVQGNHGVLGVSGLSSSPLPVHVPSLWEVGVLQIAAGEAHCAALAANGFAYTWGRGKYGQLGHGSFEDEQAPKQVRLSSTACGFAQRHSLLRCWLLDGGHVSSRSLWARARMLLGALLHACAHLNTLLHG